MAKVMLSFPDDLLAEIDSVARETGRSRSGLIQYVARLYLNQRVARTPIRDRAEVMEALARTRAALDEGEPFDSTDLIRALRDERSRHLNRGRP